MIIRIDIGDKNRLAGWLNKDICMSIADQSSTIQTRQAIHFFVAIYFPNVGTIFNQKDSLTQLIYDLLLHINRNINQGSSLTFSNTSFAHNLFFSQFNFKSKESFSIHNHLGFSVSANCYSFLRTNFDSTNTIFDYVRVYHIINV